MRPVIYNKFKKGNKTFQITGVWRSGGKIVEIEFTELYVEIKKTWTWPIEQFTKKTHYDTN